MEVDNVLAMIDRRIRIIKEGIENYTNNPSGGRFTSNAHKYWQDCAPKIISELESLKKEIENENTRESK